MLHWRASDPRGHFGRVGSCGSERQDGAPTLPLDCLRRRRSALREMLLVNAVRMIPVFLPQALPNKFEGRIFAIMPARLYACHHDGRDDRRACVTAAPRAMFAHIKSDWSRYACGEGSSKSPVQR